MSQYGFFFDQARCSGCNNCADACINLHGLPPGPLKYLKILPDLRVHFNWVACYHCEEPACVPNCPHEAIYKEKNYGAVLIDSEKCAGCGYCDDVCPYAAPVFERDAVGVKAQKCDMCIDRLKQASLPVCVLACDTGALEFGPLSTLRKKYGDCRDLDGLPDSQHTKPAIVFKPHALKI